MLKIALPNTKYLHRGKQRCLVGTKAILALTVHMAVYKQYLGE